MIRDLGEIGVPALATRDDWKGYPAGALDHPARNHPRFVRALIREYIGASQAWGVLPYVCRIHDPMCGVGTTLHEARIVAEALRVRILTSGWDIEYRWREMIGEQAIPNAVLASASPDSVDLIVTSPPYPGNHARGNTQRQEEIQRAIGSSAGTEWHADPDGEHIGAATSLASWWARVRPVLAACRAMLASNGQIIWIVRDVIREGRPSGFVEFNVRTLELAGFVVHGGFWRGLRPTANWELRAAGARKQGRLEPLFIDREWALVATKGELR